MINIEVHQLIISTTNRKIWYLTMLIVCKKNLSQIDLMDCKIITIEGEENVFWVGSYKKNQI